MEAMELKALPQSLGFGFYISDSEDSVDTAVEEWLNEGCPEKFPVKSELVEETSSEYQSAQESSTDHILSPSELEWALSSTDTLYPSSTVFPDPPPTTKNPSHFVEFRKKKMRDVMKTAFAYDLRLQELEDQRRKQSWDIEQNFVAKMVSFKLTYAHGGSSTAQTLPSINEVKKTSITMPTFDKSPSPCQSEQKKSTSPSARIKQDSPPSPPKKQESPPLPSPPTKGESPPLPSPPVKQESPPLPSPPVKQESPPLPSPPVKLESPPLPLPPVKQESPPLPSPPVKLESPPLPLPPVKQESPPLPSPPVKQESPPLPSPPVKQESPPLPSPPVKQESSPCPVTVQEPTSSPSPPTAVQSSPSPDIKVSTPSSQLQVTGMRAVTSGREQVKLPVQEEGVYPAPRLLAMSEQMNIPQTIPPPATLFALNSRNAPESNMVEVKIEINASSNAVEFQNYHKRIAQELIDRMGDYGTNVGNRDICKGIDRNMKIAVQQISADEHQVRAKTQHVLYTLSQLANSPGVIYGYVQFSRYIINRCAGISDSIVFAVARVVMNIIERHPKLINILLSFLHEVSVWTVPKSYTSSTGKLDDSLMEKLGFRDVFRNDKTSKEDSDAFVNRQAGYVKFYAAMIELDGTVHGLSFGWSYLSRMLNRNLPVDIHTASALMSFLKVAGYSLFKRYKRQFFKVLLYIHSTFLVDLVKSADMEAQAVYMRLQTYLENHDFTRPPQGKALKVGSASQTITA